MAPHEDHLKELVCRWNTFADEVAQLRAHWQALEGEHPGVLDPDYGPRLDEAVEQHIPSAVQQLNQTSRTSAGLENAHSLTRGQLSHTVELLVLPELSAELSVKEQSDVRASHMRVLAAAQNVLRHIDQASAEDDRDAITIIRQECPPISRVIAQDLIEHLRCAKNTLRNAALNQSETVTADAILLAQQWREAIENITSGTQSDDTGNDALVSAAEDISLHAQLVVACELLETFVG